MFYKCRKGVGEGKCDFFLWADEPETPSTSYSNRNSQSKYMYMYIYIIIVAVGSIIYTGIGGLLSF